MEDKRQRNDLGLLMQKSRQQANAEVKEADGMQRIFAEAGQV
jgi:hypothetical protein